MAEIINLRRARKRLAASRAESKAEANRLAFGVSKGEKSRTRAEIALAEKRLEAHRRPQERKDEP